MSSGIPIITYLASEFCRKDIASAPFGIVIIFSKFYFTTSMVSNFARSFIVQQLFHKKKIMFFKIL
jgi:hypothetical protein